MVEHSKPSNASVPGPNEEEQTRKNKTMEEWQALINDRLEEAIERGDFDNLPGKGKPLNLHDNPNEPSDMRMANRLLKNNELSPAWIADRRMLMTEGDKLRTAIARQWAWYGDAYAAESSAEKRAVIAARWSTLIKEWEEQIADLNSRILNLNLTLPIWRLELLRFNLDRELRKIGARRQLNMSP